MKRVFIGKSESGNEIVVYILNNAKDVLRLLNSLSKNIPGYNFSGKDNAYMRFVQTEKEMYLIAGVYSYNMEGRDDLETYYADEVYDKLSSKVKGYKFSETREGFVQVHLNDCSEIELLNLFKKFLNSKEDFNYMFPDKSYHMAWIPEINENNEFVLKPEMCPTNKGYWDYKILDGCDVNLF